MTIVKTIALAAALTTLAGGAAFAADTRGIDRTQAWQQHQIDAARRTGALTRAEQRALQAEQARIAELERRARADGYVSRREANVIRQAQRDAGNHIYMESHDRQVNILRQWKARKGF